MIKKIAYVIGLVVLAFIGWRIIKVFVGTTPPLSGPRKTMTKAQQFLDDNAPASVYAYIVPPLAQNVTPNAGNIILRRNDPVIPALYTLSAIGPNGNS